MEYPLLVAFLLGLFSTVHCIGMCGGIVGTLTYSLPPAIRTSRQLPLYVVAYNLGRIGSYAAAGLITGGLGSGLALSLGGRLPWILPLLSSGLLIALGLHIAGYLPRLNLIERAGLPLWRRLEPLGRRLLPVRSLPHAFGFGVIWGWLPCGLVYSALLYTMAGGGAGNGALFMLVFGLGTLPTLTVTGLMASQLARLLRQPLTRQLVGASIIFLALLNFFIMMPTGPGLLPMGR